MSKTILLLCLLSFFLQHPASGQADSELAYCDFSHLKPGRFGDFATKGFPEYHYIARQFTDGWEIVNNRGPEEWKVLDSDGKHSLAYLGFNASVWTNEFTYPILCYGDPLWSNYNLEVSLTPLSRKDLNGVIFRYQDGRHYYLFGLDKGDRVTLRYRDGEKGFRPDIPGLEFCNINFWGEPGLITLYNCSGEKITSFELIHAGSPVMPVNWRGDGTEFIFLSPNTVEGGLLDGWGRRVVMFPNDGHPDLAWMAHDMTGDSSDELIVWDTESIWIYTQDSPYKGARIYAPKRPPLYNESNYGPIVSWPAWKAVQDH